MFKRGGFASYTKTGRRMQYGAAVGRLMAKGGSTSTSNSDSSSEEPASLCGCILFIIFVYMLFNSIINCTNQKHLQPQ